MVDFLDNVILCTYHFLPCGLTAGNPGRMVQFWYFFFPFWGRGGELFSFGNNLAGPRGRTHGICSSFGQCYITLHQIFFLTILFHFDIIDITWVFILPHRGGLSLINFTPFTRGFEWILFVMKNNSPGCRPTGKQMISALISNYFYHFNTVISTKCQMISSMGRLLAICWSK